MSAGFARGQAFFDRILVRTGKRVIRVRRRKDGAVYRQLVAMLDRADDRVDIGKNPGRGRCLACRD